MLEIKGYNIETLLIYGSIGFIAFGLLIILVCKLRSMLGTETSKILQFSIAKGTNRSANLQPYQFTDQIPATLRRMSTKSSEKGQQKESSEGGRQNIQKINQIKNIFSLEPSFNKQKKRIFHQTLIQ